MKTLKEYRINKGYSHDDMAKKLNISKTYYWQLENEKRRLYYGMAMKIAEIFKTKPDKLFYNDLKGREYKSRRAK